MEVTIRSAAASDGDALSRIYAPAVDGSATSFEETVPDGAEMTRRVEVLAADYPWLVAEHEGEVVGYAYAGPFRARPAYARTAESSVYLAPEAQGKRVGARLMEALLDDLRTRKFHRVIAGATLPNDRSTALHQSLGFEFVGVFREVGFKLGRWHDVGFWELGLE